MTGQTRFPVKRINFNEVNILKQQSRSRGKPQNLVDVKRDLRDELCNQVKRVNEHFESAFRVSPGIYSVARITLRTGSLVRSHRPNELLQKSSCRVIGIGDFGELLISISQERLQELSYQLQSLDTERGKADISTIRSIKPYTAKDALRSLGIDGILRHLRLRGDVLKFRLFNHDESEADRILYGTFMNLLCQLGVEEVKPLNYGLNLNLFRLRGILEDAVEPLSEFVGTRAITTFPSYQVQITN